MSESASVIRRRRPRTFHAVAVLLFLILCCSQGIGQGGASLSGIVRDRSGVLIPNAPVSLLLHGKIIASTVSDFAGHFIFKNLPIGYYDVQVQVPGFASTRVDNVLVTNLASASLEVVIGPEFVPPPPPSKRTFTDPVWNVWEENYSERPSFQPVPNLQPNTPYSLEIDLSALKYDDVPGNYSREISSSLDHSLQESTDKSTTIDVVPISDGRFFRIDESTRAKSLTIDLEKMRKARSDGFFLEQRPFGYLREHPDAPFSFGRISFRIQTSGSVGVGFIALSFWIKGRPVDEVSVPICITEEPQKRCPSISMPTNYLSGVDPTGRGGYPDAALTLIELGPDMLAGVFRCNTCGWSPDKFGTWIVDKSASQLQSRIDSEVIQTFEHASDYGDDWQFAQAGRAFYNLVFLHGSNSGVSDGEKAFRDFISDRIARKNGSPSSIFIRLLPQNPDLLFMMPLGLMSVQLQNGHQEFLGFHFLVESPLKAQEYTLPASCISNWVLFVPPDDPAGFFKDQGDFRSKYARRTIAIQWLD